VEYYILVNGQSGQTGLFNLNVFDDGPDGCTGVGGCCVRDTCITMSAAQCNAAGGQYRGDGNFCATIQNPPKLMLENAPEISIPNNRCPAGIVDSLFSDQNFTVADVDVHVVINHPVLSDLDIRLLHAGLEVKLWSHECSGGQMDVTFDDAGDAPLCDFPTTGVFHPHGSLAAFNGTSAAGKWTLTICDGGQFGFGNLANWSVSLKSGASVCPCPADITSDVPGTPDGQVNMDDLDVLISHWGDRGGLADVSHNGIVDMDDLVLMIRSWGPCR
jgi:subtilisin-like proprotein convertase family protein